MKVYHGSSNKNLKFNPNKPLMFFTTDKDDFLDTICKLTCCLSTNEQRALLTGYNIVNLLSVLII